MTTEIEFFYTCHKCGKKIKASSTDTNTAKMVPGKKKIEWLFECKDGCSTDINGKEIGNKYDNNKMVCFAESSI